VSFLVDTDTCSAHLKQKGPVTSRFLQYAGRLHVSAVTVGELYTWALRANAPPQRLQSLLDLLNDVTVLDVTEQVGRKFGEVRAALFDVGKLIAATALVHNLTLVTHNVRDFATVPGLMIQDWLSP
jgi:tRNA(fMet)-specific endonuclease VapC